MEKLNSFTLLLCCFIMIGCGYKFTSPVGGLYQSALGSICGESNSCGCLITTIAINNKTMVPGLEDRLRYILSEELLKRGCIINTPNGISIYGSITDFNMSIVAERSNQVALYEIIVRTDFRFVMPDDKEFSKIFSSPFITDFKSGSRIEDIIMARDREIDKVMRDITVEIIHTIGISGY